MTNPTKTVGQVGYEAYAAKTDWKSLVSGAALPPYAELTPGIQEAWQASGTAVIAAVAAGDFSTNDGRTCGADPRKVA